MQNAEMQKGFFEIFLHSAFCLYGFGLPVIGTKRTGKRAERLEAAGGAAQDAQLLHARRRPGWP